MLCAGRCENYLLEATNILENHVPVIHIL